jgi:transposase
VEQTRALQGLRTRLEQAQTALDDLLVGRQGKPKLTERGAVEQAVTALLKRYQVEGLLTVTVTEQLTEHPVRPSRDRPATVRRQRQFTSSSRQEPLAIEHAIRHLGWRVYATNQVGEDLSLAQAMLAYRDESVIRRPLSLSPMYVERDDHATGLVRLLSLALRVLTRLQFVARQRLAEQGAALAGLYAGNPKRATTHPTTERLLEVFQQLTLTTLVEPHQIRRHVTALSPSATGVVLVGVRTHHLYQTLWGIFRTPLEMREP